jgi:hypothetical protein
VPVKVREWIASALTSPDLVLESEPPAQPHSRVVDERTICFAGGADTEVIGPSALQHFGARRGLYLIVAGASAGLAPLGGRF